MKAMKKIWFVMGVCLYFGLMLSFDSAFGQAEKSEKIQPEKKIAGSQIIRLHSSGGINPGKATVVPRTIRSWTHTV